MRFWERVFSSSKREQGSAAKSVPAQSKSAITPSTKSPMPTPGYDCPFYSDGLCRVGGGGYPCNLGSGYYWTDCYVYPTTGLKGKYDREQGEAARRRAQLKRCNRCRVTLQISENVDFRYAIGEFASERDFRVTSEAAGVSCAACGADFCHKCVLALAKRHPSSGGLACLRCGGRMTRFNP
jgi:hypothetical protein